MNEPVRLAARVADAPPPLSELGSRWLAPVDEEQFALPVVQNFVGSVQSCWGPAGIQNWVMPPTGLPTPTGLLYLIGDDGRPDPVDPAGTEYQVLPWEIRRRHPVVSARTRLHSGDLAVTERLRFHRAGRYALVFGGLCRTWSFTDYWNLPPEDVPQYNVRYHDASIWVGDNKTFGLARFTVPEGADVRVYARLDDFLAGRADHGHRGRVATVSFTVAEGDELAWTGVQGTDLALEARGDDADADEAWSQVWDAAFTPGNQHFSGSLPALRFGDDALDRLYYMGVLALLHGRRTPAGIESRARFATGGQAIWAADAKPLTTAYTTGATEGAATTSFLWELHLIAPLLARLDPEVLRRQLEAFMAAGTDRHWGIDIMTGRGVGMWYGINDGAVVTAAAAYLEATGDHGWLDTTVGASSVRDHLVHHVARHEQLAGDHVLADYGEAHHVLECVSSYEHRVASFNALAAWCYRFAAVALDPDRADAYRDRAEAIEQAVLDLFDDGVFRCVTPGGERVVRTCLDFMYVGRFMDHRLGDGHRDAMLRFFTSELETADWMRALSPKDDDSLTTVLPEFQTYRADHQSTGAYDGWPGLAADVRFRFGDDAATVDWLRRISEVTWEGPFGQAHWVGVEGRDPASPARKASFFNGNCYLLVSGSTLSAAMLDHARIAGGAEPVRRLPAAIEDSLHDLGLADADEAVRGTPVTGGVSSDVWRVETRAGTLGVKRALSRLKVAGDWRVSTERASREAAWLRLAASIDPAAACPVRAFDSGRDVLVLDWIDGEVWKAQLMAGVVDVAVARALGERLARLHAGTVDFDRAEWDGARALFEGLRITPYLRATAERHPDAKAALLTMADHLAAASVTLVHGDVSPKNIVVGPDGPVLLDAECAAPGDPAFDVAFCVNHLLLKAVHAPQRAKALGDAASTFVAAYLGAVTWEESADVDRRAAWIVPALALARVDGMSPVDYLVAPGDKEFVRAQAFAGLDEPRPTLEQLIGSWHHAVETRSARE